jgi:hypothetical protein
VWKELGYQMVNFLSLCHVRLKLSAKLANHSVVLFSQNKLANNNFRNGLQPSEQGVSSLKM